MKYALITGGSSGIGLEMTKHFIRGGYAILWVSISEHELTRAKDKLIKEFHDAVIHTLTTDLSLENGAQTTYEWVQQNNWTIDVLINNAGFGSYGFINDLPINKELNMIHLNVLNVFKMTRLFLDQMIQENKGTIINISSGTAMQPVPKMAAYSATKAFVKQLSESLTEELKMTNSKVKVLSVYPSAIKDTAFKSEANMDNVKTFDGLATTTAEEVGRDVWNAFINEKDRLLTGARYRRLSYLTPLFPRKLIAFLLRDEMSEK